MHTQILTLCFALTLLLPLSTTTRSSYHAKPNIPALYVFGDSLVDSGNTGRNFLPYGIDFGRKPTGRCTNGKTVADYLAIHLGLPLVPPYRLVSRHKRNKIITGINYASAGSGILPHTNNDTTWTLDRQIGLFERTVTRNLMEQFNNKEKLEKHLSESLFVVSSGVNDFFQNGTFCGNTKFSLSLLNELSLRLQRMHGLGARKFFVNNAPAAGCFPSQAVLTRPRGKCDQKVNKPITIYNRRLPKVLRELQSQLSGFTFVLADLYGLIIELRESGKNYGIVETWKPCCPNTISGDLRCHPNVIPCSNRNTHLFFDDHPSQISNQIYARQCFIEKAICRFSGLRF